MKSDAYHLIYPATVLDLESLEWNIQQKGQLEDGSVREESQWFMTIGSLPCFQSPGVQHAHE